jgi:uncharacterized protein (TIGR02231 family)
MKKSFIVAFMFMVSFANASTEKSVKSTVKKVTVFTQGAQVFRTSVVNLSPGITNLVFSGLSPNINVSTLQAGGKGSFIILDVKHQVKYPEPPDDSEEKLPVAILREIKLIEDSLQEQSFNWEDLSENKNALMLEKNMILKNKLAQGEGKSDSLAMLKQAMEFFRIKLADINSQLIKIKRQEQRILTDKTRMTDRLNKLKAYKSNEGPEKKYEPIHQVVVTVSAEEPSEGLVEINYAVSNAGWIPTYDLRAGSSASPIQLTYKASVYQNTGEEWNNVKLKLSTSNPNRSSYKPSLPAWYINYYFPRRELAGSTEAAPGAAVNRMMKAQMDANEERLDDLSAAQSSANYTQLIETMTNVEFNIDLAYSIPSDGIHHTVAVKDEKLPAKFYHFLVPKLEREAFLVAKVTGWETLNLLPGKATVFFEGTYVGQTMLNPAVLNDTLELALGRDNGITVSRTKLPEDDKSKLLGSEITKTITYELKVKNNKSGKVNLVIEDQIPLTQNKEIKIELHNKSSAEYNQTTGLLTWDTVMNTKENKSIKFSYSVTYDKDKKIMLF